MLIKMSRLRKEVLNTFKKLHRTRMLTFKGDDHALDYTRTVLNSEFKKNKQVTTEEAIAELNKLALEVENELRTSVIQAVEKKPGTFELNVRPEHLIDNIPPPGTPLPKMTRMGSTKAPKKNGG